MFLNSSCRQDQASEERAQRGLAEQMPPVLPASEDDMGLGRGSLAG